MNLEEKKELKKYLKRGDLKYLTEKAGVSHSLISRWFSDRIKTGHYEDIIIALANKRKAERLQTIKSL